MRLRKTNDALPTDFSNVFPTRSWQLQNCGPGPCYPHTMGYTHPLSHIDKSKGQQHHIGASFSGPGRDVLVQNTTHRSFCGGAQLGQSNYYGDESHLPKIESQCVLNGVRTPSGTGSPAFTQP